MYCVGGYGYCPILLLLLGFSRVGWITLVGLYIKTGHGDEIANVYLVSIF